MKKSWGIFAVIAVFLIAALVLLLLKPFSNNDELLLLNPEQGDKVETIVITSAKDSMVFQKQAGEWVLGDEVLNQQAVENLVIAGTRLVKTSIIPLSDLPGITSAPKIAFNTSKKELCRLSFLHTESGSFILSGESDPATGVELPGYEIHKLEKIFSGEMNHYRMHLLLDLLPSEVRSIKVNPLKGTAFVAEQDDSYNVKVMGVGEEKDYTAEVDDRKIRLLFTYCSGIRYSGVIEDEVLIQGLSERSADAEIEVADIEGNLTHFELYKWLKEGDQDADLHEALLVVNKGERVLTINYYFLELIIRGLENYLQDVKN